MDTLKMIIDKGPEIVSAVTLIFSGLTALFLIIPGDQPEKTFAAISKFLSKFSKK